jgi:PAS domain S-box-containing protein
MPDPHPIPSKAPATATGGALRIALAYAGFAGLWILLSDRAVGTLVHDPDLVTRISIAKGWAFVAVTAVMLFVMVRELVSDVASREAKLQTLVHAIPDLVWLKDPDGVYLGCNLAFERFFGAPEAVIIGRTDYDFVSKEQADFFRQKDREAIAEGATRENDEWVTLAATGQRVLLETLKTPIHDEAGRLIGVLGIGRDITKQDHLLAEQRALESRLHQAQKMEVVGRFAGGVAHDYNNMLGVILANADLALVGLGPERPERRHLEEIALAARHSAELTRQLLAFSRQQPLRPRPVDLNEAVPAMLGVLERLVGPGIRVVWSPGARLWPVAADPTQLDQLMTNLVVNARDAIGTAGWIELATANRTLSQADCAALPGLQPGDHVRLSVSDNGCGMAPELVGRIFEPFFTTKPSGKGTGLGLALVHGVVTQHRGALRVESRPGEGSTFHILLPRATSGASAGP